MHLLPTLLVVLFTLSLASGARADAPVVANPATPQLGEVVLPLAELWRLGGESEADEEFFGVINDVAVADNGDVYLLDTQLHEVRVFDADGNYLRSMGHEGEGPGEFRRPRGLIFLPDGIVGVVQPRPATVVLFTLDGEPAGTLPMPDPEEGGFMFVDGVRARGGHIVVSGMNMKFGQGARSRTRRLVGLSPQGEITASFREEESEFNMANLVVREADNAQGWALGPDGRVTWFDGFDYRFTVCAPDGTVEQVIERQFDPVMRSGDERDEVEKRLSGRMQFRGRGGRITPSFEVSDRDRAIRWFQRRDDGSLWVLNGRSAKERADGELGRFDVFNPQGAFVQQVTLRGEGDFEDDLILMVGDRLFVVTQFQSALQAMSGGEEDEDAEEDFDLIPMEVICYGVDWGEGAGR